MSCTVTHFESKLVLTGALSIILLTWSMISHEAAAASVLNQASPTPTYTPTTALDPKATPSYTPTAASKQARVDVLPLCTPYNPTPMPTRSTQFRDLTDFYFIIDPGHGGDQNHAVGPSGTLEKCWALKIGLDLVNILRSHGAIVESTRYTDVDISLSQRSLFNNTRYRPAPGGTPTVVGTVNNWRFVSIHLNAPPVPPPVPTTGPTNTPNRNINWTGIYYQVAIGSRTAIPMPSAAPELGRAVATQVHRVVNGSSASAILEDFQVIRDTQPYLHNILSESAFLTNPTVEARLISEPGFIYNLAHVHYRGLVDFWLTGYGGPHQDKHQEMINEYWRNINSGNDPGVPFANGPQRYVHLYPAPNPTPPRAYTQEFADDDFAYGNAIPKGSILECRSGLPTPCPPTPTSGGAGYYVRDPIWSTYIQKNGPNRNGPGLPWGIGGQEHEWSTVRGRPQPTPVVFTYPRTQNFENGVIYWNTYESSIRPNQPSHAVFLPNCRAYDINDSWAASPTPFVQNMTGRFAFSNDAAGPNPRPSPTPTLPGYSDGGIHANEWATRAQVAQALMFAEGYAYYTTPTPGIVVPEYNDIQGHWARPWIRMAASLGIASGYSSQEWRPDSDVTRQQFAKMETQARGWAHATPPATRSSTLCGSPSIEGARGFNSFQDVCKKVLNAQNQWIDNEFYTWIETVKVHNAIGGYTCGGPGQPCGDTGYPYFQPVNNVTRAQMSKIIDLALVDAGYPPGPCWGAPPP